MIVFEMTSTNSGATFRRVLEKINELLEADADFVMTRWIFDWDNKKSTIENIDLAHKEKEALINLRNQRCIDLRREDNPLHLLNQSMRESPDFADYVMVDKTNHLKGFKRFHSNSDYARSDSDFITPDSDKAWAHYDWAVWITWFDNDKFIAVCRQSGYDPINRGVEAILEIQDFTTPKVSINGLQYAFKSLRVDQNPAKILTLCLDSEPGVAVRLDDIKGPLKLSNKTNLVRIFQNTQFNKKDGVLKDFVELSPKVIKVARHRFISAETYKKIKSDSTVHSV